MKVVTAQQMRALDQEATQDLGIPSLLLMENAARGLVDRIEVHLGKVQSQKVVILSGSGNNGGDGLAAARHLRMRGAEVTVYLFTVPEQVSGDAKVSLEIWQKSCGVLYTQNRLCWDQLETDLRGCHLVIDALLGTGLTRAVEGEMARAIALLNTVKSKQRPVVSVDIPSGIAADTGERLGMAVQADYTFAIALPKYGHYTGAGLEHRGVLDVIDIGFPPPWVEAAGLTTETISAPVMKPRPRGVHKGQMGHLLVVAGSLGKLGAARMTGYAALRTGCGLVTCALPRSLAQTATDPMEMMTLPLPETDAGTLDGAADVQIVNAAKNKDAVAIGPGLSLHAATQKLICALIETIECPMVIDADALIAISENFAVLGRHSERLILTPHEGEMARLLKISSQEVQKDRFAAVLKLATQYRVTAVLKGAHTLVADPEGRIYVNETGNPGMATAGTGDVLTGVIGGLLAQGLAPLEAARHGVYFQGRAGDLVRPRMGESGLMATDIIHKLPEAMQTGMQE